VRLWQQLGVGVVVVLVGAALARAQSPAHWPQWRGPQGTGAAPASCRPPVKWDAASNVKWKVPVPGDGTSTPVIWGDQIFVLAALPADGSAAPSGQTAPDRPPSDKKGPPPEERKKGPPPFGKGPPPFDKGKGPPPFEKGKGGFGKGPKGGRGGFGGSPPPTEAYQFVLLCYDRNTGKTLWQQVCRQEVPHEGFRPGDGSFAASSAVTDGEHVLAFFGSRGLYCFDLAGKRLWEKDFGDQRTRNGFGEGATPALHGNTVVVPWDHEDDDFIVALDKRTGDELWRQERDEPTGWSTPLVVEHQGQAQVILGGTNRVRSYDLATGKQLWECEGLTTNVIPTAVTKDGVVFITSGYQGYKLLAIRLGSTGDLTGTDAIVWRIDRDTPYVASPLLSGDRLYFFKSRESVLSCVDARTGKPYYTGQRIGDLGASVYASPVSAGGHVYLVGRNGTTVVIRDADQFEVVSTNVLDDPIDASPAVAGNELFLRSRQYLYCIGEK